MARKPQDGHIESVFALSPLENVAVFKNKRTKRIALISCIYAIGVSCTDVLLYTGVGYRIVYFCLGFATTF